MNTRPNTQPRPIAAPRLRARAIAQVRAATATIPAGHQPTGAKDALASNPPPTAHGASNPNGSPARARLVNVTREAYAADALRTRRPRLAGRT